jgi:hypothetical protein
MSSVTINTRVAFAGWQADRPRRGTAADRFRKTVREALRAAGVVVTAEPIPLQISVRGGDPRMAAIDAASAVKQALVGCLVDDSEQIVSMMWITDKAGEPSVTIAWQVAGEAVSAGSLWKALSQMVDINRTNADA